jgi:Leucine-rich repeat (LRR) protein
VDEDIGYEPEYVWDPPGNEDAVNEFGGTFYEAVKMRMYGNLSQELPSYYLEDFEDIEMAESYIEALDGIEHCKHVVFLDLSGNQITDISGLWSLDMLEELFLANNNIGYIDALSNLVNLREVDLSRNEIDDISPLLVLDKLEFVNLIGNNISDDQISSLRDRDVVVLS